MATEPNGVMAAPNRCEVKARIVAVTQSKQFPKKRELELELLESQPKEGPDFASQRIGQKVEGFTFDTAVELSKGDLIFAVAAYLGGARRGLFQLSELRTVEP